MNKRDSVFAAIDRERTYQNAKWGHNPHTVGEWILIMQAELDEARLEWIKNPGDGPALMEILQVISVGVACLEDHPIYER